MLISLYRNDRPSLLLSLPVWCALPWISAQWHPASVTVVGQGLVYGSITDWLSGPSWAIMVAGWLLTMLVAAQLVFLLNDAELGGRRNHLPVILFPLFLALHPQPSSMGPELLGMPLVVLAMRRLWLGNAARAGLSSLFDTGLFLGAASIFHLPYAFLVIVVWAINAVMRPFHWRDHLVPVVGVALVRFMFWGGALLLGAHRTVPEPLSSGAPAAVATTANVSYPLLLAGLLAAFTIAAAVAYVKGYKKSVMQGKNMRAALLAFLMGCALIAGFQRLVGGQAAWILLAVPATMLLCPVLSGNKRRWLSELAVYATLAMALWAQWGTGLSSPT